MTAKKKGQKVTKRQIWLAVSAVAIGLVAVAICWAFRWAPKKQEIVYPLDYEQELLSAADEFSIDPCLLAALVYCETGCSQFRRRGGVDADHARNRALALRENRAGRAL